MRPVSRIEREGRGIEFDPSLIKLVIASYGSLTTGKTINNKIIQWPIRKNKNKKLMKPKRCLKYSIEVFNGQCSRYFRYLNSTGEFVNNRRHCAIMYRMNKNLRTE